MLSILFTVLYLLFFLYLRMQTTIIISVNTNLVLCTIKFSTKDSSGKISTNSVFVVQSFVPNNSVKRFLSYVCYLYTLATFSNLMLIKERTIALILYY